ncbi:hypothetical protein J4E81_009799 [Alternaria sp. BMP 2799]|nr:hypothetical protein J4E81_009799 [Alternaria sp. BMP 2799]
MRLLPVDDLDEDATQGACATSPERQFGLPGARSANHMDFLNPRLLTLTPSDIPELVRPVVYSTPGRDFDFGFDIEELTSLGFPDTFIDTSIHNVHFDASLTTGSSSTNLMWDAASLIHFNSSFLKDLPFQQFRTSMANRGIDLSEGLIKIAIEARESRIVKFLLDSQLLSVNDLVVDVDGQKLTAVERAAQLRDRKCVELFLAKDADVRKSYSSSAARSGPLMLLIKGIRRGETISSHTMDLVDVLLRHDSKIDVASLKDVFQSAHMSTMAVRLVSHFLETEETDLISEGMLPVLALQLEEDEAFQTTDVMMKACGRLHDSGCFQKHEQEIEWALVHSARRGHVRMVQLLLPHTRKLDRVLSASFQGGKSEVVELVLAERPDFYQPAHCIDQPAHCFDKDAFGSMTTPLAEAIRARNAEWIQLCEDKATSQRPQLTGHFEAALAAAATIGDLQYVTKLLRDQTQPQSKDMYVALLLSIQNGHDEISYLLIEAGADLHVKSNSTPRPPTPLFAAVRQRNAQLVRAILDACTEILSLGDHHTDDGSGSSSIWAEMIMWGDQSIILDVHRAFPESGMYIEMFRSRKGIITKDWLTFLMAQGLMSEYALSRLLQSAVQQDDTAMVYHLLELGVDTSGNNFLEEAVTGSPRCNILAALLDNIPNRSRRFHGFGTDAIVEAIRLGLPGLKKMDLLLASKVVEIHSFGGTWSRGGSPLGTAIKLVDDFTSDLIVVKRLLDAGCDPNSVVVEHDTHNMTAMIAAIQTKNVDLVQVLLDYGADVNTKATRRLLRTPLQAAAEMGCLEIVQLLLKENANVNALPARRGGGTALQFAAISGNCNIAAELLERNADPLMPPSSVRGRWPLEGAAEHGRLDMIGLLLRLGVYDSNHLKRAATFAEENGHLGCKDLLLEHIVQETPRSHLVASDLGSALGWMA